jgi:predicted O-methyltransferase YrrM
MNARHLMKDLIRKTHRYATGRNWPSHADPIVSALLQDRSLVLHLNDPVSFSEFLGGCFEHCALEVRRIRDFAPGGKAETAKAFNLVLDVLQREVPPISVKKALNMATVRDRMLGDFEPTPLFGAGDISWHFGVSSSLPRKGRLLAAVVRFMRPKTCLELGTAYGLSGLFILGALESIREDGEFTTVEGLQACYDLALKNLSSYPERMVRCEKANVEKELEGILKKVGKLDFVFHDAGHTGETYIRDFHALLPSLNSGAVVIVDDIVWEDQLFNPGPSHCLEGWRTIVQHERVAAAAEIDGMVGILMVR